MLLFCPDYLTSENLSLQNSGSHKVTVGVSGVIRLSSHNDWPRTKTFEAWLGYSFGLFRIQPLYHTFLMQKFDLSALIGQKMCGKTNHTVLTNLQLKCFTIKVKSLAKIHLLSVKEVLEWKVELFLSAHLTTLSVSFYITVMSCISTELPFSCLHVILCPCTKPALLPNNMWPKYLMYITVDHKFHTSILAHTK